MKVTLIKISDNLSDRQHIELARKIHEQDIDGLELSYVGGKWGPVWDASKDYDLSFLQFYKGIRALRVSLPSLTSLRGIETIPSLQHLFLDEFKTRKISLNVLAHLKQLRHLSLVKTQRDLESITELENLEQLTLFGYELGNLNYLNTCRSIKKLQLQRGTANSLSFLANMRNLQSLEIEWVKKLEDISAISTLLGLERLAIKDAQLIHVLPDLSKLQLLKNIRLMNLGKLQNLKSLLASSIKEFVYTGPAHGIEMFQPLTELQSLERVYTWLDNKKMQTEVETFLKGKFEKHMKYDWDNEAPLVYLTL